MWIPAALLFLFFLQLAACAEDFYKVQEIKWLLMAKNACEFIANPV